jgi:topoisomerase-4 subunit B
MPAQAETTLFITEGDSASGSITKSRDPNTQAVFSLRGKPLNAYGLTARWCMRTRSSTFCRPH